MVDAVSAQNRKAVNILIKSSIPPLRQALVLLKQENSEGRQFDFVNAPDLPISELVDIVNKIEKIYYQEG